MALTTMARAALFTLLLSLALVMILLVRSPGRADGWSQQQQQQQQQQITRILSAKTELLTTESVTTYNGIVEVTACKVGYYRPEGNTKLVMVSPQRSDGCVACPRGRYGATTGLATSSCTGPCPVGRYGDKVALTSSNDCPQCPPGYVGSATGSTTSKCTSACEAGKYSSTYGATKSTSCTTCPAGYRGWQCTWAVHPNRGRDQDHQHGETFGLPDNFVDPIAQK